MTNEKFHDEPDVISDEDYSQYVREEWGPNRLPKVEMSEEEVMEALKTYAHLPPIKLIP
jgi:hypothetical protein